MTWICIVFVFCFDCWDIALIKVDTEGAEAAILKRFLKYIERGQVRNVVVEVVPAWWPKLGVSVEHGIQVFEQLQSMARETVLLHDMNPFPRGDRPRAQTIDGLPTFEITDMRALLRQRASTVSVANGRCAKRASFRGSRMKQSFL